MDYKDKPQSEDATAVNSPFERMIDARDAVSMFTGNMANDWKDILKHPDGQKGYVSLLISNGAYCKAYRACLAYEYDRVGAPQAAATEPVRTASDKLMPLILAMTQERTDAMNAALVYQPFPKRVGNAALRLLGGNRKAAWPSMSLHYNSQDCLEVRWQSNVLLVMRDQAAEAEPLTFKQCVMKASDICLREQLAGEFGLLMSTVGSLQTNTL